LIALTAYCSIPASWSQKKRQAAMKGRVRPTIKPDADNVLKGCCDAINGVVWVDDKQAVRVGVEKWYRDLPGLVVIVEEIE
jgi:Holliday junction resolvase RusA-like endonuclease